MRTIVEIPDEQLGELSRFCDEQNISRAEAVRRAVSQLIKDNSPKRKDVGFGIWRERRLDSRKFVEKLRSEWGD
jgi:metal-responsive CopG/Arc/MetJ family transcriptional regulator